MRPHKVVKLRKRYLFARSGGLRLRYALTAFAAFLTVSTSLALLTWPLPITSATASINRNHIALNTAAPTPISPRMVKNDAPLSGVKQNQISKGMRIAPSLLAKRQQPLKQTIKIGEGETVAGILQKSGVSGKEAHEIVQKINKHYDLRKVKPGHILNIEFKDIKNTNQTTGNEKQRIFDTLSMRLSPIKDIIVSRENDTQFKAKVKERELLEKTYAKTATIQTSLYGSAAKGGIPSDIVAKLIKVYSWDVDFQRDIRRGDKIEVLYTAYETEDGNYKKFGPVLYANIGVRGKNIPAYRYKMSNGQTDYFQPNGHSMKKTLMKTPIDGARISSGYGMRRHPVLGYNKMHKGMDFAAPTGTPIYAAGDGVVERANRFSSYGNYVKIRHNSSLKTAYAHLHRFGKGIRAGKHVKQGQIIGYVGSTGRSTGPHLHYEVHLNGKEVNPKRMDLPTGEQLSGKQLQAFKSHMNQMNKQYTALTKGIKIAELNPKKKQTIQ